MSDILATGLKGTSNMLINCVAYQDGRKLADIEIEAISDYPERQDCLVWVALRDDTGHCRHCGTAIAGRFGEFGKPFGPQRIPVRLHAGN